MRVGGGGCEHATALVVLEYLRVLVWPSVVVAGVVCFRGPLGRILWRLKSADLPGGVSVSFEEDLREADALSRTVRKNPPPQQKTGGPTIPLTEANARMLNLGLQPSPSGLDFAFYEQLAAQDPNIALAGLRIEVETLARNLAIGWKVRVEERDSAGTLLRRLREAGAINSDQFELATKVVALCNQAVHGRRVSRAEAESVLRIASVLAEQYHAWLGWGFPDGRGSSGGKE